MRLQARHCKPPALVCAGRRTLSHTVRLGAVTSSLRCSYQRQRLQGRPGSRGGTSTRAPPVQGHGMSNLVVAAAANKPRRIALLECEDAEKWKGYTEKVQRLAPLCLAGVLLGTC